MTDVFISYSRKDKPFVQRLFDALQSAGSDVWADWADIPASADWFAEIRTGIESAGAVLFVLSPEWVKSKECARELAHAVQTGKRLVPLVWRDVDPKTVPPELAQLNWIFFRETDDFEGAIQRLNNALDTDLEWVKAHTRLLVRAIEWEGKGRDHSFVLRGKDLQDAEAWQAQAAGKSPPPTGLQGEYVLASRKDAARRQRLTLAGVTAALVISLALAVLAAFQWRQAFIHGQIALSRQLAAQSLGEPDPELGALLALRAVALTYDLDRTALPEAQTALHRAVYHTRLLRVLEAHPAEVFAVALSPDGTRLATASADGTLRLWPLAPDADESQPLVLDGHTQAADNVAFAPDGRWLVSVGDDQTIRLWDAVTGDLIQTLSGHSAPIYALAVSPDGARVATGSLDNTAKIWSLPRVPGVEARAVADSAPLTLSGHLDGIYSVAFSPDGRRLATASRDATVKIWDVADGTLLATLSGHTDGVNAVAFSPDGMLLASGGRDTTARLWNVIEPFDAGDEPIEPVAVLSGHTDWVYAVAFSPDGAQLATASFDKSAIVWDLATGKQAYSLMGHAAGLYSLAFSADGTRLATGGFDATARIWDASPAHELLSLPVTSGGVGAVGFGPACVAPAQPGQAWCETLLAAAGRAGTMNLWRIPPGSADAAPEPVLAWSRTMYAQSATDLAISPDGVRLASAGLFGEVTVWDTQAGEALFTLAAHGGDVRAVAWSPDSARLATAGEDGAAIVWDVASGQAILTLGGHGKEIADVAFSRDGRRLATAAFDNTAKVWDAETGQELYTLSGHTDWVTAVAFSPLFDGSRLATASSDGSVKVWGLSAAQPEMLYELTGHTAGIANVVYAPDGAQIATASLDRTARLWNVSPSRTTVEGEVLLPTQPAAVRSVAYSPDGALLASAGDDGVVRLFVVPIEHLVSLAQSRVTRALTTDECRKYLHVERCP